MSDALKRRCLHLYIDFPDREQERAIVLLKVPGIAERLAEEVVGAVQAIRKLDLKKAPSISETLDWARALTVLNVDTPRRRAGERHAEHDPQVRGRHPQGAAGAQGPRRTPARQDRGTAGGQRPRRTSCTEPAARVDAKLIEFADLLRQNGVRVSFAESIDTFRALEVVGLGSRRAVKDTLRDDARQARRRPAGLRHALRPLLLRDRRARETQRDGVDGRARDVARRVSASPRRARAHAARAGHRALRARAGAPRAGLRPARAPAARRREPRRRRAHGTLVPGRAVRAGDAAGARRRRRRPRAASDQPDDRRRGRAGPAASRDGHASSTAACKSFRR